MALFGVGNSLAQWRKRLIGSVTVAAIGVKGWSRWGFHSLLGYLVLI
ncbi:hypothetical protein HMPREF1861_01108 [Corynebacterium kroppenstedtii]|nr:hypothetical protein HMPREF1861_01108 [Corynebacterium kroppenstedtii]